MRADLPTSDFAPSGKWSHTPTGPSWILTVSQKNTRARAMSASGGLHMSRERVPTLRQLLSLRQQLLLEWESCGIRVNLLLHPSAHIHMDTFQGLTHCHCLVDGAKQWSDSECVCAADIVVHVHRRSSALLSCEGHIDSTPVLFEQRSASTAVKSTCHPTRCSVFHSHDSSGSISSHTSNRPGVTKKLLSVEVVDGARIDSSLEMRGAFEGIGCSKIAVVHST